MRIKKEMVNMINFAEYIYHYKNKYLHLWTLKFEFHIIFIYQNLVSFNYLKM